MNWLLIVCIVIIVSLAINGRQKGLVRVLFSLVSYILALVLTGLISPIVSDILETKTGIREPIYDKCYEMVLDYSKDLELNTLQDGESAIDSYVLPDMMKNYIKKELSEENIGEKFVPYVSERITYVVINAIASVVTFLIVFTVLRILVHVLDIVTKLPVLHMANKLGGTIAGGLEGVFIVWCIFFVITLCCTTDWAQKAIEMITESKILSWLYNNDILLHFLSIK